jgi:hypothetical protein
MLSAIHSQAGSRIHLSSLDPKWSGAMNQPNRLMNQPNRPRNEPQRTMNSHRDLLDLKTAELNCLLERLLGLGHALQHTSAYLSIRQLLEHVTSWPRRISQIIFTENFHRYCAQTHKHLYGF